MRYDLGEVALRVTLLDSPDARARAVAALPAVAPLPTRTVLVPSERHAHPLRRALVRAGRGAALAGTRFIGPLTAAMQVLQTSGIAFSSGEEGLRPARLLALFREDLQVEHFDLDLVRTTRGWDDAFASAIADLEAAGLSPADLPTDTAHARDLALVWSRVAAEVGTSFSGARIYLEAAALLARDGRAWPFDGPVLALATAHESIALGVQYSLRFTTPSRVRIAASRFFFAASAARYASLFGPPLPSLYEGGGQGAWRSACWGSSPPPRRRSDVRATRCVQRNRRVLCA